MLGKDENVSQRKSILVFSIICFVVLIAGLGCSDGYKSPMPKRYGACESNADCGSGLWCENKRCEDIYHPRREIKNY